MNEKILVNKARCKKCGDVIESKHVHDFVTCKCGAISVDCGKDYLRRVGNRTDFEEFSIMEDDITMPVEDSSLICPEDDPFEIPDFLKRVAKSTNVGPEVHPPLEALENEGGLVEKFGDFGKK